MSKSPFINGIMQLRVLSLPGRSFKGNSYFRLFCDGLEDADVRVVDQLEDTLMLRFDIVHVHFPEHYVTEHRLFDSLRLSFLYMSLFMLAKTLGKRIVWSIHDVLPFKRRHIWLLKPFMALFHKLVDGHVFMNPSSQQEFYGYFPQAKRKPFRMVPHGPYPVDEPPEPMLQAKRKSFAGEDNAFVLGFLGNIKPYKNIGALALLPEFLPCGRPLRLVVAGKKDAECGDEVATVLKHMGAHRLIYLDEAVADSTLNELIRAVDAVFLPYARGWSSGFAMLVLCNHGRVLGSSLPVFKDLKDEFGEPWIYQYSDQGSLTASLDKIAKTMPIPADEVRLDAMLQARSFAKGAGTLKQFYAELLARELSHCAKAWR